MRLQDLNLKEFLAKTYGNEPVPGGGSISALCGALSASLAQMVTGLTIGRKKYSDVENEMIEVAGRMEKARLKFLDYIDEDAAAYQLVFDAFKMPKETESEIESRKDAIQAATLHAALVPLSVAKTAVQIMNDIIIVGSKGNKNAITDACVAIMCARTAAMGAILNVRINLSGLEDRRKAEELERECMALNDEAQVKEAALLDTVIF